MIKIPGRYSKDNKGTVPIEVTAEEITHYLQNGHRGSISFQNVFGEYVIDGTTCSATAISLGDETNLVEEKDGKIIIPTYFQRYILGMSGDPHEKVKVDVIFDPIKHPLEVLLVKE